ncbi:hypothetical protein OTU49_002956, partial [Cherax quadricarinatus]
MDIVHYLEKLKVSDDLFKDVKFYVTGKVPEEVLKLLTDGGAKEDAHITDYMTHLIVGDEPDENDIGEVKDIYEKPVVTPRWVVLSVKCGKQLPWAGFSPDISQVFSGVTACVTRLSLADTLAVWGMITFAGGKCSLVLTNSCTHLIVGKPEGAKYNCALENEDHINIVTPDWVPECLAEGSKVDEIEYHPRLLKQPKSHTSSEPSIVRNRKKKNVSHHKSEEIKKKEELKSKEPEKFSFDALEFSDEEENSKGGSLLDQLKTSQTWKQPVTKPTVTTRASASSTSTTSISLDKPRAPPTAPILTTTPQTVTSRSVTPQPIPAPKGVAQSVSQALLQNTAQGLPQVAIPVTSQGLPQVATPVTSQGLQQVATPVTSQGLPQVSTSATSQGLQQAATSVTSQGLTQVATPVTSQGLQQVATPVTSQDLPQVATPIISQGLQQISTPATSQGLQQVTIPVTSQSLPQVASQVTSQGLPQISTPGTSQGLQQAATSVTYQGLPQVTTQVISHSLPQVGAHVISQGLSQVATQVTSQASRTVSTLGPLISTKAPPGSQNPQSVVAVSSHNPIQGSLAETSMLRNSSHLPSQTPTSVPTTIAEVSTTASAPVNSSRLIPPTSSRVAPPSAVRVNPPNISRVTLPTATRVTPPNNSRATPPNASRTTPPNASRSTPPMVSRAATPISSRTTPPIPARATPPANSRTTPPITSRTTPPITSRATPPASARVTPEIIFRLTPPNVAGSVPRVPSMPVTVAGSSVRAPGAVSQVSPGGIPTPNMPSTVPQQVHSVAIPGAVVRLPQGVTPHQLQMMSPNDRQAFLHNLHQKQIQEQQTRGKPRAGKPSGPQYKPGVRYASSGMHVAAPGTPPTPGTPVSTWPGPSQGTPGVRPTMTTVGPGTVSVSYPAAQLLTQAPGAPPVGSPGNSGDGVRPGWPSQGQQQYQGQPAPGTRVVVGQAGWQPQQQQQQQQQAGLRPQTPAPGQQPTPQGLLPQHMQQFQLQIQQLHQQFPHLSYQDASQLIQRIPTHFRHIQQLDNAQRSDYLAQLD